MQDDNDLVDLMVEAQMDFEVRRKRKYLPGVMFDVLNECQSPIEKKFFSYFVKVLYERELFQNIYFYKTENPEMLHDITIEMQAEIDAYRVDFRITSRIYDPEIKEKMLEKSIIVECDGHDFHERTKEQAARDKKRDRRLQTFGYQVLRFTGSEIWKDPTSCVNECLKLL